MDPDSVQAMLRKDRAEWEALVDTLQAHPEEALHDPDFPVWTSRDAYTHLACWIEHSTATLQTYLVGHIPPPLEGTDDEINARWQQQFRDLSLTEAREWAYRAFEQRLRAIENVPPERWDQVLDLIARADGAEHYANHRRYIAVE